MAGMRTATRHPPPASSLRASVGNPATQHPIARASLRTGTSTSTVDSDSRDEMVSSRWNTVASRRDASCDDARWSLWPHLAATYIQ